MGGARLAELPLGAQPGPRTSRRPPQPLCRRPHPDKSLSRFQHHDRQACSLALLRASCFACPQPGAKTHRRAHTRTDPLFSFHPRCQNFSEQVQPGASSLTLSRQLTFSVGYTTFPQRAHWGFIVAVPGGGGWAEATTAGGSEEPL